LAAAPAGTRNSGLTHDFAADGPLPGQMLVMRLLRGFPSMSAFRSMVHEVPPHLGRNRNCDHDQVLDICAVEVQERARVSGYDRPARRR
jgi:hypothetical protein